MYDEEEIHFRKLFLAHLTLVTVVIIKVKCLFLRI